MRRLLLPFLLAAAAATTVPAAAEDPFCFQVQVGGSDISTYDTGYHCAVRDYRYTIWCENNTAGVDPDVIVNVKFCIPGV